MKLPNLVLCALLGKHICTVCCFYLMLLLLLHHGTILIIFPVFFPQFYVAFASGIVASVAMLSSLKFGENVIFCHH